MALSDLDVRAQYNGNGSNQTFAIPFAEIDGFETETKVYLGDTLQTLTSDYTISSTNVVFVTAPPSGTNNVTIIRQLTLTQPTDLLPSGAVDLDAIEAALDRVAALIQQVEEKTDRAPLLKITSANSGLTLPEPASDQVITWNNAGTDLENKTVTALLALDNALTVNNNLSDLNSVAAALSNLNIAVTTGSRALQSNSGGTGIEESAVTSTELGYVSGVTSAIQTQIDSKVTDSFTASRALESDGSGNAQASSVTSTELGYVSGVSSAIQTQIDTKAPTANPDFTGEVDLTDQAQLNFFEGSGGGSNRLSMKAPATLAGDVDWILPSADGGADQFLKTDGSGNLSFDNPPSGFSNPMTTGGDLIYGGASGVATRLANGSANQVLTSAGGTSAPTWESLPTGYRIGSIQTFTANGTWTKPAGCTAVIVKMVGGGAGGGGAPATSGVQFSCAAGGSAGGYVEALVTDGDGLGSSETVTVGAGGSGGSGANGSDGGNTTFGSHLTANGGTGGQQNGPAGSITTVDGRAGGSGTITNGTGLVQIGGSSGGAFSDNTLSCGKGGAGGQSAMGGGAQEVFAGSGKQNGQNAGNYGGGGSGSCNGNSQTAASGGDGQDGVVFVYELYD